MKLYVFPVAPNPTKVRLYLAERKARGASLEIEEVWVDMRTGDQRGAEHRARNPLGKLPVLQMTDGRYLIESRAIIDYLEGIEPAAPLFDSGVEERARQHDLERVAELGVLTAIVEVVHNTKSPLGLPPNAAVAEYFRERLVEPLTFLENIMSDGREFVSGSAVSLADCTLEAGLHFGRYNGMEFLQEFPLLEAWSDRYRHRAEIDGILLA